MMVPDSRAGPLVLLTGALSRFNQREIEDKDHEHGKQARFTLSTRAEACGDGPA